MGYLAVIIHVAAFSFSIFFFIQNYFFAAYIAAIHLKAVTFGFFNLSSVFPCNGFYILATYHCCVIFATATAT